MNIFANTRALLAQEFGRPSARFRGAPFWSWNTALNREQLLRQIDIFKTMGFGGFHIHVRTGLQTEYLGTEFMEHVKACVEYARQQGMLVWLYDEDRWPSGYGGGRVTQNTDYRARHLLFTPRPYDGTQGQPILISSAQATRLGNGILLARYAIRLEDGFLASYRRLQDQGAAAPNETIWYAYLETAVPSPWFNNQTYVDTLNKQAIERFIEVTHEVYAESVGDEFGQLIPAIFTDEPQFAHKVSLPYSDSLSDIVIPFTTDFLETYQQTYHENLADALPELFWELPEKRASRVRYRYHDHLAERFASAYADTLGAWCAEHGLALTGHMMDEPTLQSQTGSLGEAMRSYRAFHLPGIDMLCDWHEYTTAKQAQSAAHQYARPGTMSEIYGVTNWDFDFAGHKAAGDWQTALGVILRVHHLSWVSMAGEAKRDYPASIHYQSPWHHEYPLIEDHFARVNSVLTQGQALVRVGVLHPIESYWLCFGPLDKTSLERYQRDQSFKNLTEWLLFGLIDFDFIAESLLPDLYTDSTEPVFAVGAARYDVVLVPPMRTMRATTLEKLEQFAARGGKIVFSGEIPSLVDAVPSACVQRLAGKCIYIDFAPSIILQALTEARDIAIHNANGTVADNILYQMRQDAELRYLFCCNTDKARARHALQIALRGHWQVTLLDTFSGEHNPIQAEIKTGWTQFTFDFEACGSLLACLTPASESAGRAYRHIHLNEIARLSDPVPITLSEPNVLLLDRAAVRLDDEDWQPPEEILRLDNRLRKRLGYPLRMEAWAQPWVEPRITPPTHIVSLRYQFSSTVSVTGAMLALENAADTRITFDGNRIASTRTGFYADESIETIALPTFAPGTHTLELSLLYDKHTQLEACYLLGDFGVVANGQHTQLCPPVSHLTFGDWTRQGLPFYGGNVTYHCTLPAFPQQPVTLQISKFHAPLIGVNVDGERISPIALPPYQTVIPMRDTPTQKLDLTVYGSRINTFGALHNADASTFWFGPMAWRTENEAWSDEYQLRPCGIFVAPRLLSESQLAHCNHFDSTRSITSEI